MAVPPDKLQNNNEDSNQIKKDRYSALLKRVGSYKQYWDKDGVIQFKSEYIAILQRKYGTQVEFIIAFEDLTKEGYSLMAIDEGKESSFASGVNSFYYFQKIK